MIVLNCATFGVAPQVIKTYDVELPNGNLYPQGITCTSIVGGMGSNNYGSSVYICGFGTPGAAPVYPGDPTFLT